MLSVFFFNDTATTEIYTLSLHDALPISAFYVDEYGDIAGTFRREGDALVAGRSWRPLERQSITDAPLIDSRGDLWLDRKSTRLNSSHANISYAVFCLKKKKKNMNYIINK